MYTGKDVIMVSPITLFTGDHSWRNCYLPLGTCQTVSLIATDDTTTLVTIAIYSFLGKYLFAEIVLYVYFSTNIVVLFSKGFPFAPLIIGPFCVPTTARSRIWGVLLCNKTSAGKSKHQNPLWELKTPCGAIIFSYTTFLNYKYDYFYQIKLFWLDFGQENMWKQYAVNAK